MHKVILIPIWTAKYKLSLHANMTTARHGVSYRILTVLVSFTFTDGTQDVRRGSMQEIPD